MILKKYILVYAFSFVSFVCVSAPKPVYINSVPKCGTHLLARAYHLMSGQKLADLYGHDKITNASLESIEPDTFYVSHVHYSKQAVRNFKNYGFKVFFIYRDPRDHAVSYVFYQRGFDIYDRDRENFNKTLTHFIKDAKEHYSKFLPWLNSSINCVLRFEDLVGAQGGGSLDKQVEALKKIADFTGIKLDNNTLSYCLENLWGQGSRTFRNGKIGSWRDYFTPEQKQLFKELAGDLLIDLGYEKDLNW